MSDTKLTPSIDFTNFKVYFDYSGSRRFKIASELSCPGKKSVQYEFLLNDDFYFEIRLPNTEITTDPEEIQEKIKTIKEEISKPGSIGANFYLRIGKNTGTGSLEIFAQHIKVDDINSAIEIQCKLHLANGHKNDHIVYINHLIPIPLPAIQ